MDSRFDKFKHDPEVNAILKMKANRLATHPLFRRDNPEHIENDLWSHLFEWVERYTPDRGTMQAYAAMLADSWSAMEIRSRKRLKRQGDYRSASIEALMVEHDGRAIPLSRVLGPSDHYRRIGQVSLSDAETKELREALTAALRLLTPEQRELIDDRIEYGVEGAAERHGVSPSTVNRRLKAMRQVFEKAGLGLG